MKCDSCDLDFPPRWHKQHRCIGTPHPTIDDIIAYTGAQPDEYGCLIPMNYERTAGQGRGYWQFPRYVKRMLGESYIHRAVLSLKLGRPLTPGLDASHACGIGYENKHCINPEHLVEETRKQNHARMPAEIRSRISSAGGKASPTQIQKGHVPWNKGQSK